KSRASRAAWCAGAKRSAKNSRPTKQRGPRGGSTGATLTRLPTRSRSGHGDCAASSAARRDRAHLGRRDRGRRRGTVATPATAVVQELDRKAWRRDVGAEHTAADLGARYLDAVAHVALVELRELLVAERVGKAIPI